MAVPSSPSAAQLRREIAARTRLYARGRLHVESYGGEPVVVYAPEGDRHGNFFDAAYRAICCRPEWHRRFDKVHAQARRALPKAERRWRELDSSMSSDALLMNIFCAPGVIGSPAVAHLLGVDESAEPIFGWRARVPLKNGRFDRTEVDLRFGPLLVEAKLTESDFQRCTPGLLAIYRDLEEVFDLDLLPRVEVVAGRRKVETEFPEDYSQEYEEPVDTELGLVRELAVVAEVATFFDGYQLIRNVLAAHAAGARFCVLLDERRPDLREAWFDVMAAVRSAELRVRLMTLTWQELAATLPAPLREFLDVKYGIVPPGEIASPIGEIPDPG